MSKGILLYNSRTATVSRTLLKFTSTYDNLRSLGHSRSYYTQRYGSIGGVNCIELKARRKKPARRIDDSTINQSL